MPKLLVVDDEPATLQLFRRVFAKAQIEVVTAETAKGGFEQIQRERPDAAVVDVVLPDKNGLQAFAGIQQLDPKLPVIFVTAHGTSETAIEAMKLGALDYLVKPLDFGRVRELVDQAFKIRRFMQDPVELGAKVGVSASARDALVGRCTLMQQVYKAIGRVAPQNVTVLIRGESGTGKELVARALYHHSKRAGQPFMEVNSAAIPEALLESELFGHEKGAFTGAERRRIGKFEQCNGGTLFLDEIGDMSPTLQAKILRVLQEQRFERVGGNETITTDVRVVAATNRDLEQMVAENQFRDDLYYRLNGFTIKLPTLHERGNDDLTSLVEHFLLRANDDMGKQVRSVSPEAMDVLQRYHWPGNVRELRSVIRQAVLQSTGPVVMAEFLPETVLPVREEEAPAATETLDYWDEFVTSQLKARTEQIYDHALHKMEAEVITRVLQHTDGNQVEAAKLLGITRTTLRSKIRNLGIAIDRVISADEPNAVQEE